MTAETWREAMDRALYAPGGFFVRHAPAGQFRTSVHASPLFAGAVAALVRRVAAELPGTIDVVDIGAGRGELLTALRGYLPDLAVRYVAVERAGRPDGLSPDIDWLPEIPARTTGLLLATEWLDNVPVDVVERDPAGVVRVLRTDDTPGPPADAATLAWLAEWWPEFDRAEPGLPRDEAWRRATAGHTGLALAVDYGHLRADRPAGGTLTGYRDGRQVVPRIDGSTDITAHVAMDSLGTGAGVVVSQREALRALGVSGVRPPLALASTDPLGYLRRLSAAGEAAELTDPAGLGGHWWLFEGVGLDVGRCFP